MKAFVLGTHEYQWALRPFGYLFKKYWGRDKVTYVGDKLIGPLPNNIEFMQVPAYREGIWDWEKWFSNGLVSLLEIVEDPVVAIFLPDHWITRKVNRRGVKVLTDYMIENQDVIRGNLTANTPMNHYGKRIAKRGQYEILTVSPSHEHAGLDGGITFCPSLWNPKNLIQICEGGWNLWGLEKVGTEKMRRLYPRFRSIGTAPPLLYRAHALNRGRRDKILLEGLESENREMVKRFMPEGWEAIG